MCFFDLKIKQYVEYLKVLGIERATTEPSPAGKTKTQMLLWNAYNRSRSFGSEPAVNLMERQRAVVH